MSTTDAGGGQTRLDLLPATELAGLIRSRELSPVELLERAIARIEERDPIVNAFVHTAFDEARTAARRAERAVLAGEPLGPLHGLPTAIKDLFTAKRGWPWTAGGIRALQGVIATQDSLWVQRMERAGAIVVGRTNSPVLGFRGTCDNPLFGPTRNPFDLSRNSGGSSGGAAAAVAEGMVSFAQGTDAGGSIRIPAAWCGLYGFKPGAGRVPIVKRPNGFGTVSPFVHDGVLTRTVADSALTLEVLCRPDPRDPFCHGEPPALLEALAGSVEGWRIAYSPDLGGFPVDPGVAACVAEAVRAFEEAGAIVEEVEIDLAIGQRELSDLWCRQMTMLNVDFIESLKEDQGIDLLADHREDLPPELVDWCERAYQLTAMELLRDERVRTRVFDDLQGVLESHELLVTPTVAVPPVPNAADGRTAGPSEISGVPVDPLIGWCLTYPINLTGHPAASIPAGLVGGPPALPVGMQLIGRRLRDLDVIAASAVFERLRPWSGA